MAPYLELEHICHAQQGFLRPLVEGRLAVENIVTIGVKSRRGNEVEIEAIVVRSTNINKDPVTVNVCIMYKEAVVEKRIKDISCTCPAGACKKHCCKHAMAVIIHLERKDESEIEVLTCTDTKQVWDKLKESTMSKFDPVPVSEFCCFPKTTPVYRRRVNKVTPDLLARVKEVSLKAHPQSEAAIFWIGVREPKAVEPQVMACPSPRLTTFFQDAVSEPYYLVNKAHQLSQELLAKCSPAEREYYAQNIVLSTDEALQIFLGTTEQDNSTWDGARFGRITGSISYELFTYYLNKTPDWENKLTGVFENRYKNDAMAAGNLYESYALKKYVLEESKKQAGLESVKVGILINPLLPWLGFSADAVICINNVVSKLWENKTPVAGRRVNASGICKHLAYMNKEGKLKHKCPHYGQVQLGMVLLNLQVCDFTVYCTGPVLPLKPKPNPLIESVHVETVVINHTFCDKYLKRLCHVYFEKILPWLTEISEEGDH
ncbi:uncharacterized protein LOC117643889 [Thrips palmi]|uniref:Uncharacterized protein LOC117643889 n=1 Tax=Thrips palmi TaxID=161013 RepID=A0A6P8YGR7_THRPL|nr:uncharacterized protein LOC117643889 [Thrips palmi]